MRFATRTLRSSVVRVVAAFAPLIGCSDFHEPMPEPTSNPPPLGCGESGSGCVPVVTENPPPPPLDAGRDAQIPEAGVDAQQPSDAKLSIDAKVPGVCPAQEPARGSACDVDPEAACEYGPLCGPHLTRRAQCVQGAWQVAVSSCNPPPPSCPTAEPSEGAGCQQGWAPAPKRCSYGSCDAGGAAAVAFECSGSSWTVVERCGIAACPSQTPSVGGACNYTGGACGYGNCAGAPTIYASCTQGAWSLQQVSCNPPPPSTCPALAPAQGSSCTHNGGSSCVFSLSVGGQVLGDCVNGRWELRTPDAGS
jgi:hypothetical protein